MHHQSKQYFYCYTVHFLFVLGDNLYLLKKIFDEIFGPFYNNKYEMLKMKLIDQLSNEGLIDSLNFLVKRH